ncbi:MAG: hypothetical protein ACJAU2_001185 [Maribacter sp.]
MYIICRFHKACDCKDCEGSPYTKIWCFNPSTGICLKEDESILEVIEGLIKGTQFILNMDVALDKFNMKPKKLGD